MFTSNEKKRRLLLFGGIGLVIAGLIVFLSFSFLAPKKPSADFRVSAAKSATVTGKAGGEGSEEYNEKLKEHDEQQASSALKAGDSYVPTPVGKSSILSARQDKTTPAAPAITTVRVEPARNSVRTDDGMGKRMLEDLATLDSKLNAVCGQGSLLFLQEEARSQNRPETRNVSATSTSLLSTTSSPTLGLKAGDLLYAVVDTGVNSDIPSAVMATVVSGKYNKTRLIGKFQRFEERLVLGFSRAVLPDGRDVQLEAYAIDPDTTEASVASSSDTHFLSRWGGLVASAFLEGLGEAKRYSGAQSTMYDIGNMNSDRMVWKDYSLADQGWIAAGKVGEKAGSQFEKSFTRPPTVRLESGSPIGVLILNVKS